MPTTRVRLTVRWLSQINTSIKSVLQQLWNSYEILMFVITAQVHTFRSPGPAPVDPYHIYHVSPSTVSRYIPANFDFLRDTGCIIGGEWDQGGTLVINHSPYNSFYNHFVKKIEWRKTDLFQRRAQRIQAGNSNRYVTIEELETACNRYDHIYQDIKKNGYRTQRQLLYSDSARGLGNGGLGILGLGKRAAVRHEIAVNIGRDGSMILNDGRHRLAIALLLDLDTVPVRIVVRHAEWQKLRNRLYESAIDRESGTWDRDTAEEILADHPTTVKHGLEHPDLKALLPTE